MKALESVEYWFLTGSQHLYGDEALKQVAENSGKIVEALNASGKLSQKVVFKPLGTTPTEIFNLLEAASNDKKCAGVIAWMHTFSPAKMWINGLKAYRKPLLHLHTQFNRDLPYADIDMDFMNLNQSAHGDREFGFIGSRLRYARKVVVGHWSDEGVQKDIDTWMRAATAWADLQGARFARFGDNMRQVAVTDGDKVAAEIAFGYTVDGYGIGDLVAKVNAASESDVKSTIDAYLSSYDVVDALKPGGTQHDSLVTGARIECGLRNFLEEGNFKGFTTTFEDLHGLDQLPGLAVQRLMADGYGFGAEGDWKTCALLRAMKVMANGMKEGTSFMEDYTYHLEGSNMAVLGSHMLEICETIAAEKPKLEIHPLGIGGKADPVRLVFNTPAGAGLNASLVDMGNRFRLLVNTVDVVETPAPLPKLPVARALWKCQPDFQTACAAWIYAGGAHHTGFSLALNKQHLLDFAEIAKLECLLIDENTTLHGFKNELRWNDLYYQMAPALGSV